MDALQKSTEVRPGRSGPGAVSAPQEPAGCPPSPGRPGGHRISPESQPASGQAIPARPALPGPASPSGPRVLPRPRPGHTRPAHLVLADVVGGDEDADADGDKDEADDEEGRQHRARRQDGLPSRQPLLLERRVVGLAGLHDAPTAAAHRAAAGHPDAARGVPVRLLLGAVVHRHGTATASARHVTRGTAPAHSAADAVGAGRGTAGARVVTRHGSAPAGVRESVTESIMESWNRQDWKRPARASSPIIHPALPL